MSMTQIAFFNSENAPSSKQIEDHIQALGYNFKFQTQFENISTTNELNCTIEETEGQFVFDIEAPSETLEENDWINISQNEFNKVIIFNWGADYSAGAIIGLISLALIEFCNSKVYYLDDEMEYTKQMLLDDTPQFLNEIQKHKNRPQPKSRPITTPKKKKSFWDKLFGK